MIITSSLISDGDESNRLSTTIRTARPWAPVTCAVVSAVNRPATCGCAAGSASPTGVSPTNRAPELVEFAQICNSVHLPRSAEAARAGILAADRHLDPFGTGCHHQAERFWPAARSAASSPAPRSRSRPGPASNLHGIRMSRSRAVWATSGDVTDGVAPESCCPCGQVMVVVTVDTGSSGVNTPRPPPPAPRSSQSARRAGIGTYRSQRRQHRIFLRNVVRWGHFRRSDTRAS